MRLAIAISVAAAGFVFLPARADGPFIRITLGLHGAYIVSGDYAAGHKSDLVSSIPGPVKLDGFWTPPEQDVRVADRVFREMIHAAMKDPTVLFPDLTPSANADPTAPAAPDSYEYEQNELVLVSKNYEKYLRQYVGIIIDGQKLVFCNYSDGTKVDPSTDYIFIHKVFVPGGTVHFLQCRFDPQEKTCSNVSMIGSWQPQEKGNF